jgi:hypothetical protein
MYPAKSATIAGGSLKSIQTEKQLLLAAAISGVVIDYILMCVDSSATILLPVVTIALAAGFAYRKRNAARSRG